MERRWDSIWHSSDILFIFCEGIVDIEGIEGGERREVEVGGTPPLMGVGALVRLAGVLGRRIWVGRGLGVTMHFNCSGYRCRRRSACDHWDKGNSSHCGCSKALISTRWRAEAYVCGICGV